MSDHKNIDMALSQDDQYLPHMSDSERHRVDKIKVSKIKSPDTSKMMSVHMGDRANTVYYTSDPKRYSELLERKAKFFGNDNQGR